MRQKLLYAEAEVRDAKWRQYCAEKECRNVRSRWRACDRLHAVALQRQKDLEKRLELAVCQVERRTELVGKVDKDRRLSQDMQNKERELCQERIDLLQNQLDETMRMLRSERVIRQEEQADIDTERAAFHADREEAMRTEASLRAELALLKQAHIKEVEQRLFEAQYNNNVNEENVDHNRLHSSAQVVDVIDVVVEKSEQQIKKTVVVEQPEHQSFFVQDKRAAVHEKLSNSRSHLASSKNIHANPGSPSRASSQTRRKSSETQQKLRGSRSVERPSGQRGRLSLEAHLEERRRKREERQSQEALPERSKSLSSLSP
jgi:hypothetical protein